MIFTVYCRNEHIGAGQKFRMCVTDKTCSADNLTFNVPMDG